MKAVFLKYVIICFVCISFTEVYGHGDLHKRILETTEEIKKDPKNLALYQKRGKLYLEHEEYEKCLKDLKVCRDGAHSDITWLIYEARAYYAMMNYESGLSSINEFLATDKKHVRALRIQGNILHAYGCYRMATEAYENVINYSVKTLPENYLECADAYLRSDLQNRDKKASGILEKGINQLGNIPVLFERLVTLNLDYRNQDAAIAYQSRIIDMMNRKENAFYKRALIRLEFDNKTAAKKDLELAKSALNELPERIKKNSSSQKLLNEINTKLNAL